LTIKYDNIKYHCNHNIQCQLEEFVILRVISWISTRQSGRH